LQDAVPHAIWQWATFCFSEKYMRLLSWVVLASSCVSAANINLLTADPAAVAAFQTGAIVHNFESVAGKSGFPTTTYNGGELLPESSLVFDEIPGVQFSVGGMVGTNRPALYSLSRAIANDAQSVSTVLGPVDFDGFSAFNNANLMEMYFPIKRNKVGFWTNPSLGQVRVLALTGNFAFDGDPNETVLESVVVNPGAFVGFSRDVRDIGGLKILALTSPDALQDGFTIDDLTLGRISLLPPDPNAVPEPSLLVPVAAVGLLLLRRAQRK
jgi:hypothetical protein